MHQGAEVRLAVALDDLAAQHHPLDHQGRLPGQHLQRARDSRPGRLRAEHGEHADQRITGGPVLQGQRAQQDAVACRRRPAGGQQPRRRPAVRARPAVGQRRRAGPSARAARPAGRRPPAGCRRRARRAAAACAWAGPVSAATPDRTALAACSTVAAAARAAPASRRTWARASARRSAAATSASRDRTSTYSSAEQTAMTPASRTRWLEGLGQQHRRGDQGGEQIRVSRNGVLAARRAGDGLGQRRSCSGAARPRPRRRRTPPRPRSVSGRRRGTCRTAGAMPKSDVRGEQAERCPP